MTTVVNVHGNAVSFPETPSELEQVEGIAWTDIVGLRRGWGTTYRGKPGRFLWFHFAMPTMALVRDVPSGLARLRVFFDVAGAAKLESVHLWSNMARPLHQVDNLAWTADNVLTMPSPQRLDGDLGISIGVSFDQAADITFRGLQAELAPVAAAPAVLNTSFGGTATLVTTHESARGPFAGSPSLGIQFSGDRRSFTITSFAPIMTMAFPVNHPTEGMINVITTVSLVGARPGSFDPTTGRLDGWVSLDFRHRNAATGGTVFLAGPSQTDLVLTTESVVSPDGSLRATGSRMDGTGNLTIVGASVFRGGFLNGSNCSLSLAGAIDPRP